MSKFESGIKQVPYPQSSVYAKLSDLSNMSHVRGRLDDPATLEKLKANVPEDKLEAAKRQLKEMKCTADSVSINVAPVGELTIRIIEREPDKCVKFESVNAPIKFNLWIQMLPTSDSTSKMKLTIDASLNFFMKGMLEKPLKEGIEKLADVLAAIPYE